MCCLGCPPTLMASGGVCTSCKMAQQLDSNCVLLDVLYILLPLCSVAALPPNCASSRSLCCQGSCKAGVFCPVLLALP